MVEEASQAEDSVHVRDFGASADDPGDQAGAIREAIDYAITHRRSKVIFDAGTYTLTSAVTNEGTANRDWSSNHLFIGGCSGLTLEGQCDAEGNPATILEGYNGGENQVYLPSILWVSHCDDFALRNVKLTRSLPYSSAGVITDKGGHYVVVEVFEGNPVVDGMACYCANRFDLTSGTLVGESVTYGTGAGTNWYRTGSSSGRAMRLDSSEVARQVAVGEGLSWHFGSLTDFQLQFEHCSRLTIDNIHTSSANGFAMQTECCSDVKAARVVFKPEGSLLFTAPRDAWKIYKCSGDFTITDMHVEGVRMDGQNMHSTFLVLKRVIGRRTAVFHAKWNYAPLKRHTGFEFWIGTDTARRTVDTWRHDGYRNGVNVYTVSFTDDLPDNVSVGTNAVPQCWSLSSYSLDGGQFRNVAGCGHVVRYDNVRISSVTYANLMNQAIFIGCEYPGFHEAGHPKNVHIRGCSFDNCGYTPRMGAVGAIGINADGFDGPYMDGIVIEDCLFRHLDTGTDISDAKRVTLRRNRYEDVRTRYRLDDNTTSDLVFEDD